MFLAAFGILVLRRPETLLQAEFFNEDGQIFYIATYFDTPVEVLTRPYAGYHHLAPRLISFLERGVDPAWAPFVGNLAALVVVAALAAFIAGDRLSNVVPDRRVRLLMAGLLVVAPNVGETLGSATYLNWYMGLLLFLLAVAASPASPRGLVADIGATVLAGLSGPFSILFLPLFIVRSVVRRDRASVAVLAAAAGCAALQLATIVLTGRRAIEGIPPIEDSVRVVGFELWAMTLGATWTTLLAAADPHPLIIGAASCVLVALLVAGVVRLSPRPLLLAAAYASAAVVAVSIATQSAGPNALLVSAFASGRYFLLPTALFGLVVGAAAGSAFATRRDRFLAVLLLGLAIVAAVGDFRLLPHPAYDWSARAGCIGGAEPCDVPVPFMPVWEVHWPGRDGTYVQPEP